MDQYHTTIVWQYRGTCKPQKILHALLYRLLKFSGSYTFIMKHHQEICCLLVFSPNVFNQTFNKTVVFWRSVTWYCFNCIQRVACVFLTNNVDPSLTAYVSAKPFTWSWNRISGQNTWNRSEIPFRFANRLLTKVIGFLLCLKISWKIIH